MFHIRFPSPLISVKIAEFIHISFCVVMRNLWFAKCPLWTSLLACAFYMKNSQTVDVPADKDSICRFSLSFQHPASKIMPTCQNTVWRGLATLASRELIGQADELWRQVDNKHSLAQDAENRKSNRCPYCRYITVVTVFRKNTQALSSKTGM